MRPIPEKVKQQLSDDKFMKSCCLCGATGKIEWHHNLIFKGKQSDDPESILPLCPSCHNQARNTEVKEKLDLIMLNRMPDIKIDLISKAINYKQRKKYLNEKYNSTR